ncbi:Flp pilus assembly protein CpaB [Anatilimnocola floriformis]|uniref:Flp pilus assembly protein CpaB n=1 Tax=Anatilimnocola floriformis TaxID=2948575 RepID=UPI0020C316F6|nr:Flp pilus assembly protein CpaB [Anatilimnocola floriformis]
MKSLVLIFIALGCGLVASIGISQVMNGQAKAGAQIEMEPILVTLTDIDINAGFSANNVKLEPWPKMKMPEGAIRSLDEVKDKFARQRFIKGEPILADKITDSKHGVALQVPPGFRVFTVKVDEESVMRGIAPGDRIDISLYVKRSEEISEPGTYTIMQAVRVFSVGAKIDKEVDPKAAESQFRTISLLVTPEQVRHLAGAVQIGKLSFTLRNPNEPIDEDAPGVTSLPDILKGNAIASGEEQPAPTAPQPAPAPAAPAGSSLTDIFGKVIDGLKTMKPPAVEAQPNSGYKMHIYTNSEVKQYEWQDRNGMPQESTLFSTGSAGPSSSPAAAPAAGAGVNHRPGYLQERRAGWMTENAR